MAATKKPLEFHAKRPWGPDQGVEGTDEDDEDDNDESENGFSMEEVLRLGGTKHDYLLLAALDENEEVVDGGKKGTIDDLQRGELEAFIQNLNLTKYAKAFVIEDEPTNKEDANKKANVSKLGNKKQNAVESERTSVSKLKNKKRPEQHSDENSSAVPKGKKDKQQDVFEFFERQALLLKPGGKWKMLDPGLRMCSKQAMFLNLVYKSLKADIVLRRVKAFVKRLLQVTCEQMPPFICGALYLVSEILKAKPGLRSQLEDHLESDDEENFIDVKDDEDIETFTDADKEKSTVKKVGTEETVSESHAETKKAESASWVHFDNLKGGKRLNTYDPFSRNPLFCGAENTSFWELKNLSEHFHPSVALFAKTILQGNYIEYSGDPLQDFTLMRFLDRFVYRNPKPHKGKDNTDSVVMQPKRKHFMKDTHSLAVNSKEFLAKEESQIPVDQVFFYRYYKKVAIVKEKQKRNADEESIEDVDDEEFEKMIDTFEDDNCFTSGKDDLDFAGNVKKKTKRVKGEPEDGDSEDSDDDLDNLDDDEVSIGSMNEEFTEIDEDGGTFMDVLDDEELNDEVSSKVSSKKSKRKGANDFDFAGSFQGPRGKKKRNLSDSDLFVSAEEFGHLLDENMGSKFDNIGMNAMANKDNASLKQLRWEAERDDWLHNRDVKSIIKKKKNFKKRRPKTTQKIKKQRK
ncbi:CCAAT/enhancer-binding protein zeta isoform X2 [Pteronotus mesoamericanus]|uniref:CCAAT/enhancer-binding protein zeta isoform X2 n=1 Tax=Pteronotus mesoamericanus TaxID=1884717 RepID=UPI0023EB45EA|nr:CCAAT/enhancer-binding protein zeta isoform X2 [Pteronotus parnellii mesoamericanus]